MLRGGNRRLAVVGLLLTIGACGGDGASTSTEAGADSGGLVTVISADGMLEVTVSEGGPEVTITTSESLGDLDGLTVLAGPYAVSPDGELESPALIVAAVPAEGQTPLAFLARVGEDGLLALPDQVLIGGGSNVRVATVTNSFSSWVLVGNQGSTVSAYSGLDLASIRAGFEGDPVFEPEISTCGTAASGTPPPEPSAVFADTSVYRSGPAFWAISAKTRNHYDQFYDDNEEDVAELYRKEIPDFPAGEGFVLSAAAAELLETFGLDDLRSFDGNKPATVALTWPNPRRVDAISLDTCVEAEPTAGPAAYAGPSATGAVALAIVGADLKGAATGSVTAVFRSPAGFPGWLECLVAIGEAEGECGLFSFPELQMVARGASPGSFATDRDEFRDTHIEVDLTLNKRYSDKWHLHVVERPVPAETAGTGEWNSWFDAAADGGWFGSGEDEQLIAWAEVEWEDPAAADADLAKMYGAYGGAPAAVVAAAEAGEPVRIPIPFNAMDIVVYGTAADGTNAVFLSTSVTADGLTKLHSLIEEIDPVVSLS